ncbi:endonuclease/exonuclease/phosphatase family protein [Hoylesella nanceiensis]|uniref:endonuclease/exonuclease/phosphatase family protein n=1 Tax=Hoylesella nanceiensis TaxID=425941 RepID=UPI001CAF1809|nr:endonuclease/exonuclease/phosphatase family protein [Hoylesella nanceiensis]MBF1420234.1 endonuclease/exonuclease/phosphatase family protein [Hoylesella nanceiensis]MBF1434658.1 endonuclease/exonuclease/phosphatase family protein [Hoylesella nanceiensis]MBF1440757.1 endonuclease/exonuclease/phosphatase family protein [Hoylesella nanceiensis]
MKHFFFAVIGVLLAFLPASAQKKYSVYGVGFYNQENLFDTCHDEGKRDYDFLPTGSYKWNAMKYNHKLNNMSRALADMGTDVLPNIGCAIIGLAEVENSKALDDLIAQPALSARNYQYVHIEGPDRRGIDCALLYNPSLFSVKNTRLVPYVQKLKKDSAFYTRGFLTVSGTLADENVAVIVCHLPSRFSESFYRELGAEQVKAIKDSLLNDDPNCKVFVMGDMNDDPIDKSMAGILKGKANIKDVNEGDMYNPWYNILVKEGVGTLLYQGSWNLFDQILLTPNLLNKDDKKDFSSLKFWKNQIFKRDYLFQTEGKYKGSPKRTTAGGVWLDGYSDHLPVVVYLVKEQ